MFTSPSTLDKSSFEWSVCFGKTCFDGKLLKIKNQTDKNDLKKNLHNR